MTTPITKASVEEMLARAEKATEWTPEQCEIQVKPDGYVFVPECATLGETVIQLGDHYEGYNDDWVFCAHARTDLPALARAYMEAMELLDVLANQDCACFSAHSDGYICTKHQKAWELLRAYHGESGGTKK